MTLEDQLASASPSLISDTTNPATSNADSKGPDSKGPSPKSNTSDRRFNLVFRGIPESPQGTPFPTRLDKDFRSVTDFLLDWDFRECYQSSDVKVIWSSIKHAIHTAIDKYVPLSHLPSRQNHLPKWFTSSLWHDLKRLRTLRCRCTPPSSPHLSAKLQALESQIKLDITSAKADYLSNLVSDYASGSSSKIFSHIRSVTQQRSIPPKVSLNGVTATTDEEN